MKKFYELDEEILAKCAKICNEFMSQSRNARQEELLLSAEARLTDNLNEDELRLFRVVKQRWEARRVGDFIELVAFALDKMGLLSEN